MQATVRTFDPTTRSGMVLLDDGVELPYSVDALPTSGLRHLRIGQRVRIELDDVGAIPRITGLTIYTL